MRSPTNCLTAPRVPPPPRFTVHSDFLSLLRPQSPPLRTGSPLLSIANVMPRPIESLNQSRERCFRCIEIGCAHFRHHRKRLYRPMVGYLLGSLHIPHGAEGGEETSERSCGGSFQTEAGRKLPPAPPNTLILRLLNFSTQGVKKSVLGEISDFS